jgi:hypothetical protein
MTAALVVLILLALVNLVLLIVLALRSKSPPEPQVFRRDQEGKPKRTGQPPSNGRPGGDTTTDS